MANASDQSPYLLANPDSSLPNSQTLAVGQGLGLNSTGPQGNTIISLSQTIASLEDLTDSSRGLICKTNANEVEARTLVSGDDSIQITNPTGEGGDIDIRVPTGSSVQNINVELNGVSVGTVSKLNLIPGAGMGIVAEFDAPNGAANVTYSNSSGQLLAPVIVQTENAQTPNGQALDELTPGSILKVGDDGVVEEAVAGTDYVEANANLESISNINPDQGTLIVGNGSSFAGFDITESDNGKVLGVVDGQWATVEKGGGGDASEWSTFAATQDVDMNNNGLTNIDAVHFRDNGLTSGKTFEIANNSGADPSLRINRYQNGTFQDFGILFDSRYNVPAGPSLWANYAAIASINANNNDLVNGRYINGQQARLWQSASMAGNSYRLSYDATGLKLDSVDSSGTVTETGYVYDSVINPPPSGSSILIYTFTENDFSVPTSTMTEIGNAIECTRTGYYNITWEVVLTRFIDGTNFTNITFVSPAQIQVALQVQGSSPAVRPVYQNFNSGNFYAPVGSGQEIFKYTFTNIAQLTEGETYVMAVAKDGTMTWGSGSLTCNAVYLGAS
jgi:hypothetical protein